MSDDLDDCWDDDSAGAYEDVPLYMPGTLAAMDKSGLQREWEHQCNIYDSGVDRLPMEHCTIEDAAARMRLVEIEDAAARMRLVEAEQLRRGFDVGPSPAFYDDTEH